jgi:hypothetical protein
MHAQRVLLETLGQRRFMAKLALMCCLSGPVFSEVYALGLDPGCLDPVSQCGSAAQMLSGHERTLATQFADSSGLQICEIIDPNQMLPRGVIPGASQLAPWGYDINADLMLVANQDLSIYSIADLDQPQWLATVPVVFSAQNVAIADSLALVNTRLGSLEIFDITVPVNPIPLGTVQLPSIGTFTQIKVAGNLAYVAGIDTFGEVTVVDFSNPLAPSVVASIPGLAPRGLDLEGDLLAVAGKFDLTLLDVSVPASPQFLGDLTLPEQANAVQIVGSDLFIATGSELLQVDIADPMQPVLVGTVGAQPGMGLFRRLNRLYASDQQGGCVAYAIDACGNGALLGDCDQSGLVDWPDYVGFEPCMQGPGMPAQLGCDCFDLDLDSGQTVRDAGMIQQLFGR